MKITFSEDLSGFTFDDDITKTDFLFSDLLASPSWLSDKVISLVLNTKDYKGNQHIFAPTRNVFLEKILYNEVKHMKNSGFWDLDTGIHRIYAIMDGKDIEEADAEIQNLCSVRSELDNQMLQAKNSQAIKEQSSYQAILDLEFSLLQSARDKFEEHPESTPKEITAKNDKVFEEVEKLRSVDEYKEAITTFEEVRSEKKPFLISEKIQEMVGLAFDETKPEITLANVSLEDIGHEHPLKAEKIDNS